MNDRLLLDTHAFLWFISASSRLSATASQAILNKKTEVFISKVSYWEICLKISIGKLSLMNSWEQKLKGERKANRFTWLNLEARHCEDIIQLPWHHKDPFDRMLISQARTENLTIVSCDEKMQPYEVNVLW